MALADHAVSSGPIEDEVRVVARYVAESAQEVLPVFEDTNPVILDLGQPLMPHGSS
jgi:hypothetical protein